MKEHPMGSTREWSRFAVELRATDLPDEVRAKLRLHVIDQLGAQLAGSTRPWNQKVRGYAVAQSRPGPASVVGGGGVSAEWAAFANATAGHGFEIDDYHAAALAHPGCVAVPTTFAVAEDVGASADEVLVALALGFEAIVRVGLAAQPSMIYDRGFHETCAQGVFGAALAAGRLRGLEELPMAWALGIAGSHASGTTEYSQSGGEVKRLHAGLGAMGGIRGVELAALGVPGPTTILEGRRGFLQAFADTYRVDALTDGLGERWDLLRTAIKPYFSCALTHAPIDALRTLIAEEGVTADDVQEIVVGCDDLSLVHVGKIGPHPQDMTGAQFSLEYSLAMALVLGGNDFARYVQAERDGYRDPAVLAVAERVRLEHDDESEAAFPERFFARVRVTRRDGSTVERARDATGSPEAPMSEADIRDKYRRMASTVVGEDRAVRVETAVDALFDGGDVAGVLAPLREVSGG
jgi:2-methylcitrate dehydratase PrpD